MKTCTAESYLPEARAKRAPLQVAPVSLVPTWTERISQAF